MNSPDTAGIIRDAIASQSVCTIRYHGGSQPGAIRTISPQSLDNKGYVRAHCKQSGVLKTFRLDRIEICDAGEAPASDTWDSARQHADRFDSLVDVLDRYQAELEDLGWHVQLGKDRLSLHRQFKNGRPLKTADVSIDYAEMTCDEHMTEDGEIVQTNWRPRQRPWTVRGKGHYATYSRLDRAVHKFMIWADEYRPNNAR